MLCLPLRHKVKQSGFLHKSVSGATNSLRQMKGNRTEISLEPKQDIFRWGLFTFTDRSCVRNHKIRSYVLLFIIMIRICIIGHRQNYSKRLLLQRWFATSKLVSWVVIMKWLIRKDFYSLLGLETIKQIERSEWTVCLPICMINALADFHQSRQHLSEGPVQPCLWVLSWLNHRHPKSASCCQTHPRSRRGSNLLSTLTSILRKSI